MSEAEEKYRHCILVIKSRMESIRYADPEIIGMHLEIIREALDDVEPYLPKFD